MKKIALVLAVAAGVLGMTACGALTEPQKEYVDLRDRCRLDLNAPNCEYVKNYRN